MKRQQDPVALAQQLLRALGQSTEPSNEDEPAVDEAALRERARRKAELMRKSRHG